MGVIESTVQPRHLRIEPSDADETELLKLGNNIVIKIHLLMNLCQFYGSKLLSTHHFIQEPLQTINLLIKKEERVQLKIINDDLFFNGQRIRYSAEGFISFKYLMTQWKKRSIGEIIFNEIVDEKALGEFISALTNLKDDSKENAAVLMEQLVNHGISSIEVGPLEVFEGDGEAQERARKGITRGEEDQREEAKKVFFETITAIKRFMDQVHEGKLYVNVRKLKRLAQKAVHLVEEDESYLLGMAVIKNYDEYTFNHSVNVFIYSLAIGRRLGLSRKTLTELGLTALLHDIGKSKIPKEILNKPGPLDEEEWAVMKRHPLTGVEIVLNLKQLGEINPRMVLGIFEHHLKNNLSGYPKLFWKKEINLFGQIIQVADAYDAMTTPRIYKKKACIPEEALAIMLKDRGSHFDPILLKVFIGLVGIWPIGSLVLLDTNELGIVYKLNPKWPERPQVILIAEGDKGYQNRKVVDLIETDGEGRHRWSIIKTLDPFKHHVDIGKYFL